jgi:hypothetical protein
LQQNHVPYPKLGICMQDFMEASQGRKIFPLPSSSEIVYELLPHPELFR